MFTKILVVPLSTAAALCNFQIKATVSITVFVLIQFIIGIRYLFVNTVKFFFLTDFWIKNMLIFRQNLWKIHNEPHR